MGHITNLHKKVEKSKQGCLPAICECQSDQK